MRTRLTELLDIEHPIMLAGMGGVSYHRLVAAVSDAGGIGTLGASTMSATELPDEMAKVRELTAKPFGVDLLTALPGQVEQGLQDVIDSLDAGREPSSPPESARTTVALIQAILMSQARGNVKVMLEELAPANAPAR